MLRRAVMLRGHLVKSLTDLHRISATTMQIPVIVWAYAMCDSGAPTCRTG